MRILNSMIGLLLVALLICLWGQPTRMSEQEMEVTVGGAWGPCATIAGCTMCKKHVLCTLPAQAGQPCAAVGANQGNGGCSAANKLTCTGTSYWRCTNGGGGGGCGVSQVPSNCGWPNNAGQCPAPGPCIAGGGTNCKGCL